MLDNFRELYNKELKHYEHEGGLTMLILNSTAIRVFVYEVCKACVASQPSTPADEKSLCKYCQDIGRNGSHSWFCRKCGSPLS